MNLDIDLENLTILGVPFDDRKIFERRVVNYKSK